MDKGLKGPCSDLNRVVQVVLDSSHECRDWEERREYLDEKEFRKNRCEVR